MDTPDAITLLRAAVAALRALPHVYADQASIGATLSPDDVEAIGAAIGEPVKRQAHGNEDHPRVMLSLRAVLDGVALAITGHRDATSDERIALRMLGLHVDFTAEQVARLVAATAILDGKARP